MKLVFVAGPYRANDEWHIFRNIRQAENLALELWHLGLAVICPHKNTEHFGGAADDTVWLDGAIEMLSRCDAVVCTNDWKASTGAQNEIRYAKMHGIPVLYSITEVREWLGFQDYQISNGIKESG
jgi:hypothetical protein